METTKVKPTKIARGSHNEVRDRKLKKDALARPEKDIRSLPADLNLSDLQKKEYFLSLATMNYIEATRELGLGERYTTENSLRAIGYRLLNNIDADALGISKDAQKIVMDAIERRKLKSIETYNTTERSGMPDVLDPADTRKLIDGGKNKALLLIHRKFDGMMNSKKKLEEVSLTQLTTALGTLFDKSQILRGEATENIAVMAKIDSNMTPEQSLEALLRIREIQQEEKHG